MGIFRLLFSAALAFFGAVAMFMGTVMMLATLKSGAFWVNWGLQDGAGKRHVRLSENADEFWLYFAILGVAPVILGWLAIRSSRRFLRG